MFQSLKKVYLILVIVLIQLISFGQKNNTPLRVEFNSPKNEYPYNIINLNQKGIILYYEFEILSKTKSNWRFINFDPNFRIIWQKDFELERHLEPIIDYSDTNFVGVLLSNKENKKANKQITIIYINDQDSIYDKIEIVIDGKEKPRLLFIDEEKAIYTTYNDENEDIYLINFLTKQSDKIVVPSTKDKKIQFISKLSNSKNFIIGIRNNISKSESEFFVITLLPTGEIINRLEIPKNNDYHLNNLSFIEFNKDTILFFGTYINKSDISSGFFSQNTEENTGVFSFIANGNSNEIISETRFYNYSKFNNINKYLSIKDIEKINKKNSKDSIGFSLNLQLLNHPLQKLDTTLIYISESIFPQYRTEENITYDFYGRPYPHTRSIFEGYKYTNSMISAFNKNGELIWNNIVPLNNLLSFDLRTRTSILNDSNNFFITYCYENELFTTIINKNEFIQNTERNKIELLQKSDFAISTKNTYIKHWYKNYFLLYGYQEIRNDSKNSKNRRNVFFITKMVYKIDE